uniref:Uncharacterized protein n=1 Tax=Rangifer tarandus platyrhynchus TaxID=3082113 RepID=A0ACB0EXT4_RANTA|nr:unnamed protein product [Rangifer tarandus platyrhynchus]
MTGRGAVLRARRTPGTEVPRAAHRAPDENDTSTRLAPAPRCGSSGDPRALGTGLHGVRPGPWLSVAPSPRPHAQRWVTWRWGQGGVCVGGGGRMAPRARPPGVPPGRARALTLSSRAPPGAPLRPDPASVPRCLTLLAGGSGRGRSAGGCSLQASSGPNEGSPPPAARRPPRAPRPADPRPRVRRPQSLRPARGRTLAERRRSGPGGASPASTCPTSGASARRQRRAPPARPAPSPTPGEARGGGRVRKCHRLLSGADWPLGLRVGHAQSPAPDPAPKPHFEPRPQAPPGWVGRCRAPPLAPPRWVRRCQAEALDSRVPGLCRVGGRIFHMGLSPDLR